MEPHLRRHDVIDDYVETLCGGSDTKYMYKGKCLDMGFVNAGVIKGTPDQPVTFHQTVHGPVIGYATVKGVRVAISQKRSSYGKDVLWQLPFEDLTVGRVHNAKQFMKSMQQSPFTFNSGYADDRNIAMYSTGFYPLRPEGRRRRPAHQRQRQLRVEGLRPAEAAPAGDQLEERRARELEQQAGERTSPPPTINSHYGPMFRSQMLAAGPRQAQEAQPGAGRQLDEPGGDHGLP